MVASVGVVADRDTVVTLLEKEELCLGCKCFDKGVRLWQGFGLGRSQDRELSHGGLQAWVNRGSMIKVRMHSSRLRPVVDTRYTCDYVVRGGLGGHLPTLLHY